MWSTLEELLKKYDSPVIKASVREIVNELHFNGNKKYISLGYPNGAVIHHELGFINNKKFRRYLSLDFLGSSGKYLEIRGIPDRISYKNGKLYVDELKTTIHGKEDFIKRIGFDQLQLYMFITGIENGRLYIFYKDTNELVIDKEVTYNQDKVQDIVYKYLLVTLTKEKDRVEVYLKSSCY